jgi:hypothetical protein
VFITDDTNLFLLLLILSYVFIAADTNLCFRLFTSNRNILITFLSFDFLGFLLVLSPLQYYSFNGMQCLYRHESSMGVLDDDGTTFLRNVCNNSPITSCHIPEDLNL